MFAFTLLTANVAEVSSSTPYDFVLGRAEMWRQAIKRLGPLGAGVFAALLAGAVQATPVHYSESVSGDLTQAPSAAFLFEVGTNTISGTTDFLSFIEPVPNCHFCVDFDSFAFTLPTNTKLADVSLSFGIDTNNVSAASSDFTLCTVMPCGGTALGSQRISFLGSSPVLVDFGGAPPLEAGTYTVLNTAIGIAELDTSHLGMGWTADYKWSFRVTTIPEPSSLVLMAIALGGLGFVSLRRKH